MLRRIFRKRWVRWMAIVTSFLVVALGALILLAAFVFGSLGNDETIDKSSALKCTCEWARLAPLPATAENVTIDVTGNIFTRGFIVEFTAPRADMEKWLRSSPGTRHHSISMPTSGSQKIEIEPGGGAQFAEVVVSRSGTKVRIRTYWS